MKKILLITLFLLGSLWGYGQSHHHGNSPNSMIFPIEETGYDWQSSGTNKSASMWVGITISSHPNKNGNYSYTLYMSSKTLTPDGLSISNVVVGEIDILYFSPIEYFITRSEEQGVFQSDQEFKEQIIKEKTNNFEKEHLFNPLSGFSNPTLIITSELISVHTFFLPDNESEIIVNWEYIKKIDK